MPDLPSRIEVRVNTLAKPDRDLLMEARTVIRLEPQVQQVFTQARERGLGAEALADALWVELTPHIEDYNEDSLWQTCRYLADEYLQLGDHILLISTETGQAIARVSDEDVYVPAPVSRETEDGEETRLATPLPRLKPELEGAIVQYQFQKAQDQRVLASLTARTTSTELLRQEGDPRLLRATATGRKRLTEMLMDELPQLWGQQTGTPGEFLRLCQFKPATEEEKEPFQSLRARVITSVVDPLTSNLRHDPFTALKRQIKNQ